MYSKNDESSSTDKLSLSEYMDKAFLSFDAIAEEGASKLNRVMELVLEMFGAVLGVFILLCFDMFMGMF
jgi:hypothetical protein